jgi:hypothetical protein
MASKEIVTAGCLGKMAFKAETNSHGIILDAESEVGSENRGPHSKPLILIIICHIFSNLQKS